LSQERSADGQGKDVSLTDLQIAGRVLYLDMNVWVDMARGCSKSEPAWIQLRDRLLEATSSGQLVVPLSPAHYLELWHRRDDKSRRKVAELMRDITRYVTVPSAHVVRQLEAHGLVAARIDADAQMPAAKDLLGRGASHAFGRPHGRFRFVDSIASPDGETPEGPIVTPPPGWEQLRQHPQWEWFQLFGMEEVIPADEGFDRTPEHRFGSAQLDHELGVRDWLRSHPEHRQRLRDLVVTEEFVSMSEYLEEACRELHIQPWEALMAGAWEAGPAEAVRDLVLSVPSANVWSTLRYLKHRDLNLPWEQHDWTDLWSLSVAIPYCDAVVTEKRWAHLATVGGLANRYGTSVDHGRRAVEKELTRAGCA
jgi:hypothetical protein